jgi:hypothetical protein
VDASDSGAVHVTYGPFEWHIEVCVVCGCQLGPGIGSHTNTGRCVQPSHRSAGGMVVRVVAAPDADQPPVTVSRLKRLTYVVQDEGESRRG